MEGVLALGGEGVLALGGALGWWQVGVDGRAERGYH